MNWNSRSGDLKVNRENGTHARTFSRKKKFFFLFSFSFFFSFFFLNEWFDGISLGLELHSCY